MAATQPKTPWGYQRVLRPALAAVEGVACLGGPRRWWMFGSHARGVSVFFDDDDSIHVEVCVISLRGTNPRMLGLRIQEAVVSLVSGLADTVPASVDVVIVPGI